MTDPAELDDEIRRNVQARLDEKAARRQRMKRRRAEFDAARQAGVGARHATKLRRIEKGNQNEK